MKKGYIEVTDGKIWYEVIGEEKAKFHFSYCMAYQVSHEHHF